MTSSAFVVQRVLGVTRSLFQPGEIGKALAKHRVVSEEVYESAQFLKILQTKRQNTWLIASAEGLDCVVDVVSDDRPRFLWHIKERDIVLGDRIVLPVVVTPNTDKTGYVVIDGKRPRKFSLSLFTSTEGLDLLAAFAGEAQSEP